MKIFDLALKYLDGIDLSKYDLYSDLSDKNTVQEIKIRYEKFRSDKNNQLSNDHYKGSVFTTAIIHLAFKLNNKISFFDVAREIIESEISILNTDFEKYGRTVYPQVMMDKWDNYCDSLEDKPQDLAADSEIRPMLFFIAFHHFTDN